MAPAPHWHAPRPSLAGSPGPLRRLAWPWRFIPAGAGGVTVPSRHKCLPVPVTVAGLLFGPERRVQAHFKFAAAQSRSLTVTVTVTGTGPVVRRLRQSWPWLGRAKQEHWHVS